MTLTSELLNRKLEVQLPLATLEIYQKYSDRFLVPLDVILQGELKEMAQAMVHNIFTDLEQMDSESVAGPWSGVTLSFTSETYAILDRLAHLLRRDVEELSCGLLGMGSKLLRFNWEEAEIEDGIERCIDLACVARDVVKFNIEERMGKPRVSFGKEHLELHDYFGIAKPEISEPQTMEVAQ